MKKLSCLVVSLCLFLCSCANIGAKTATLEKNREIPENGIISADVFESLKENNSIGVFSGESGSVKYKWTVFGSNIKTAADCNLKVDISGETESSVTFEIPKDSCADYQPQLSLYLNRSWGCESAEITAESGEKTTASVTEDKNTVINIKVTSSGKFTASAVKTEDGQAEMTSGETSGGVSQTSPPGTAGGSGQTGASSVPSGYSDGTQSGKDKYETDPVPAGKPLPVDKDNSSSSPGKKDDSTPKKELHCTISIECSSILNHIQNLKEEKLDVLPSDGIILEPTRVSFYEGESVYDVLSRICNQFGIHMEASFTPMYNSNYIKGINNLYEFDCGDGSGWMYRVNGWYPNYGVSRYALRDGDVIEFRYTCELGDDIGGGYIGD